MYSKEIDTKGQTNPGEIKLNANPKVDPAFAVEQLLLRLSFTLTNAHATLAKSFTTEGDWDKVKVKILKRDSKPIVNSISCKTLESLIQVITGGFIFDHKKFKDFSIPALSSADVAVDIMIPFRLAFLLANGTDTDLAYDLIGDCSVLFMAPADANLTMSNPSVSLVAVGHRDHNGHVKLGPTLEFNEASITATAEDKVAMAGDKMLALALLSRDKQNFPVDLYQGPQIGVDSDKLIVDLPTMPVSMVAVANGDIYSQVPQDNTRETVTHGVALFRPHGQAKISELPDGAAMNLHYGRVDGSVALQKYVYGHILLREPPVNAALAVIPAFSAAVNKHGARGLGKAGVAYKPQIDPKGTPTDSTSRFLPIHLRLPGVAPGA